MRRLRLALASAIMLSLGPAAFTMPSAGLLFDQQDCRDNCVLTLRSERNLIIVAKDSRGAIIKTRSFAMPAEARLLYAGSRGVARAGDMPWTPASQGQADGGSECVNTPGVCTSSDVRAYTTPGFYVFYTYTFVHLDGNLLDIEVEESRIARNIID